MAFCLYVAIFRQFLSGVRIGGGCGGGQGGGGKSGSGVAVGVILG